MVCAKTGFSSGQAVASSHTKAEEEATILEKRNNCKPVLRSYKGQGETKQNKIKIKGRGLKKRVKPRSKEKLPIADVAIGRPCVSRTVQ